MYRSTVSFMITLATFTMTYFAEHQENQARAGTLDVRVVHETATPVLEMYANVPTVRITKAFAAPREAAAFRKLAEINPVAASKVPASNVSESMTAQAVIDHDKQVVMADRIFLTTTPNPS
jgi:hypothetical protein